jgi:hypothetical protein
VKVENFEIHKLRFGRWEFSSNKFEVVETKNLATVSFAYFKTLQSRIPQLPAIIINLYGAID